MSVSICLLTETPESVESSPVNEEILTRSRFRNKTLANQAIFLVSISTTFITPPNYYMWLHVIAFLVLPSNDIFLFFPIQMHGRPKLTLP